MLHLTIVAVGRVREKYLVAGIEEYLKRLRPYARVRILEAPEEKVPDKPSPAGVEQILASEGRGIGRLIPPGSFTVALDREGIMLSSEELAGRLADLALAGKNEVALIIGGTLGLATFILQQADLRLSFSRFTFPHQLMRLILLEQLYRAFKIQRGETYHR
ncbi:23S rRNA (pseudouridine(1915)-N(3))-methyltransferase RlmH [Neomoorella thermoacetica]|uniref:Ribosomal RNA large subunit methyltransferase H n=2 Tax=Neomoorella thermoacetica TaxID=1525 RepID=A0A1D7XEP0_NEOTH|nr:23S rRNA (pseudouridine(1915)-N(3))-methyltransferase RlmH [Moorella thermoacetica]MDN5325433.1 rRNA (pseudouridine1915-N3)-methyltransferase [Moorella sp. (in: firmicutes)]AOQ25389.1 Ribosomal RNA large subunit methyltransferase H [Moorella thermoacetica]APC09613.1 ribosomal RNA large subunit methyltransferase H [Moorella thermoacetica]OIQ10079.1 ribosomal RNA large subunit methyltransferase H [Moorella thermoacetica]OIQ12183.1 ribosomal RNA large subunit methyltransferase H [Moorella ther